MIYRTYTPAYPLSQYVHSLWFVSGETHYIREKVLPTGMINLMINLGSPHKVVDRTCHEQFDLYKDSWISGFQTEYLIIEATAETNIVGIWFKPGGAYPFFDFPISEMNDYVIDMDLIWGSLVNQIRERLYETDTLSQKFQVLEALLLEKLSSDLYGLDAIQYAIDRITRLDGFSTVRALSEEVGMSQKHLIHQFKKMVGVSPKLMARIYKFNAALNSIDPSQRISWSTIAQQCHYYDQAHFNKDFTAFSGLSPSDYIALRKKFWDDSLQQGESVNFVPIS